MNNFEYIGNILGVPGVMLRELDSEMSKRIGNAGVIERIAEENKDLINRTLGALNVSSGSTALTITSPATHIREALKKSVALHEAQLLDFLKTMNGENEFQRAADLAKKMAKIPGGFFLKKNKGEEILRTRVPENLLRFLGASNIDEVLEKHDVTEVFSALRFIESNEWMHETFEIAYSSFTYRDFEEREIEIKVLGPEWQKIAEAFIAKKHHNVSHLKEFGVIFLNPIKEDVSGKFIRDFALLLHYFHEVKFYSDLFKMHSEQPDFSETFKALLRGDVNEVRETNLGDWLIVQRYLIKENPNDARLFLPRVNPESLHWLRGERDLALFNVSDKKLDLNLWHNLDWVGGYFPSLDHKDVDLISFDLEDNAMSLVSSMEGQEKSFSYHQREAMWTKIFSEYVGGEEKMEGLLINNFREGLIKF